MFPDKLSQEDWMAAVQLRKTALQKVKLRGGMVEDGVAWAANNTLQTERKRKPMTAPANSWIPIIVLFKGSHWTPDTTLSYLAHTQLGLPMPSCSQSGVISSDQLIKEFKDKIGYSIGFAQCYFEPTILPQEFLGKRVEGLSSRDEYERWRSAILNAPKPKHPERHVFAESLKSECENIMEQLELLESSDKLSDLSHLCMLMNWAFEAGKTHAYLEREKDRGFIAENLLGARMMADKSSPERKIMEDAFYAFWKRSGKIPRPHDLRSELGVAPSPASVPGLPSEFKFKGFVLPRERFKDIFDQIKKAFKKKRD